MVKGNCMSYVCVIGNPPTYLKNQTTNFVWGADIYESSRIFG